MELASTSLSRRKQENPSNPKPPPILKTGLHMAETEQLYGVLILDRLTCSWRQTGTNVLLIAFARHQRKSIMISVDIMLPRKKEGSSSWLKSQMYLR